MMYVHISQVIVEMAIAIYLKVQSSLTEHHSELRRTRL